MEKKVDRLIQVAAIAAPIALKLWEHDEDEDASYQVHLNDTIDAIMSKVKLEAQ